MLGVNGESAVLYGLAYHKYDERNRYWFNDHGGPDFELGTMYRNFAFTFYIRPWSVNGNREVFINGDTLHDYARFNDIKIGINLSYLFCLNKKLWIEPLIGLNNTSFHVLHEEELETKYDIPSYYGIHYGTGIHFVPARQLFTFPIISLWTSFSNADSRKVLPQLGTWFWQTSFTFTFKLWGFRYVLLNKNQEQGIE